MSVANGIWELPDPAADRRVQRALILGVRVRAWLMGAVYTVGTMCVVERTNGDLLLVRPTYRCGFGFPGGFIKFGEEAREAIERELAEEVGILHAPLGLVEVYMAKGRRHVEHLFAAQVDDHEPSRRRRWEIAEADWFALDDLPSLQPEAQDALLRWTDWRSNPGAM